MQKIVFSVLALVLALLFAGCVSAPSASDGSESITLAYLPATQSVPLFVAVEEGLFEQEGLQVNLQRIETPKGIIDGLVSGAIDAGPPSVAAGITTVLESQNPGALKVYALACSQKDSRQSDVLLVPMDSTIVSIGELKGKRVGHIPGIQWQSMVKKTLLANGVNPNEVTLVELPASSQLPSLAAHGVDAMFVLEPIGLIGEQKNAAKLLMAAPFERFVVNPWCGGAGVLSSTFVQNRPETAERFVKVMNEAMERTKDNPKNAEYMQKYLQLPPEAAASIELPDFIPVESLSPEVVSAYQSFADVFFELGVTQRKIVVQDLFWSGS